MSFSSLSRNVFRLFTVQKSATDHLLTYAFLRKNVDFKVQQAFITSRFANKKEPLISVRKAVIALCCFGMGGGVYGYLTAVPDRRQRILEPYPKESDDSTLVFEIPSIEPSRKIDGPATDIGLHLTLYQYQTCPFCCKVRAFLNYYGIPYDVVEVNPVMRQQLRFSKYKKVPILLVHDKKLNCTHQLKDSSSVISALGTYFLDMSSGLPNALKYYKPVVFVDEEGQQITQITNKYFVMYGEKSVEGRTYEEISRERKWRRWADNDLVHILSPNIYRTFDEAIQSFNYFSEVGEWAKNFSYFERMVVIYVGATAMYFIGKKLKKKYSLKDNVRESLYDACRLWVKEIGNKSAFLGGDSPNLADLEIYGMLSSIEGCSAFQDTLSQTNIGTWYNRVKEEVTNHRGYNTLKKPLIS